MRTVRNLAASAAVAALAFSTVAADGGPTPPTVTATATPTATGYSVSGSASAEAPGPESVEALFGTSTPDLTVASQAGLVMEDALIEQIDNGLRFTWIVDNLHAPAPPEGVRYNWSFAIDGQTFQLQAKTSNLVGTTVADDPAGHVTHAGASFQVRGNCEAEWMDTPVANCPHIGWATGAFDPTNNLITMDLEYGFHESFVEGVTIEEHQTASMSIAASGQAAVSNTTTSTFLNGWKRPYSAGLTVFAAVAADDANPAKLKGGTPLTLAEDGTFSGEVEADIESGDALWIVACTGFTCNGVIVA